MGSRQYKHHHAVGAVLVWLVVVGGASFGGCGGSVDCDDVHRVVYHHGGTSGPCGPKSTLTIDDGGAASLATTAADPPPGETECPAPTVEERALDGRELANIIEFVCEDYNDHYEAPEQSCEGAFSSITLYEGDNALAVAELSCQGDMMEESIQKLRSVEELF